MDEEVPHQSFPPATPEDMSPHHQASEVPSGSETPHSSPSIKSPEKSKKRLKAPQKSEGPTVLALQMESEAPQITEAPKALESPKKSTPKRSPKKIETSKKSSEQRKSEVSKKSPVHQKSEACKELPQHQQSEACKESSVHRKSEASKNLPDHHKSESSEESEAAESPEDAPGSKEPGQPEPRKPRRYDDRDLSVKHHNPLREEKQKVIVLGYPHYTQAADLTRAFAKIGEAEVTSISTTFATLSFDSEKDVEAALQASRKINVYGEFVSVKPYSDQRAAELVLKPSPKREFTKSKQKTVIIEPTQIELSGSFCRQLERVLAAVRLTQEDVGTISTLYTDLERALREQWPGCTAIPFGSITTGLGIKTSDADCFIHVPARFRHPHANFVNKAKKILMQYPHIFDEILSIPRANTPIVKLYHVPTDTNCDLTFKTPLGAQNSKLIAFLLHADPRLLPVAVLIKYWAKVHDLTGTGKLTNYALTMLIIFYLQQPPISILPSVDWLQQDKTNDIIVDFWNTGFMNKRDKLPECTNTSSIAELLGGFFEYYALFNFEEMIVCPYAGYPIKKDTFYELDKVPSQFQRYRNNLLGNLTLPLRSNTPICVQDPFEQCHNVACTVTNRLTAELKTFFKFAANAYEKEKLNDCEKFLQLILLEKPKIARAKAHPEYRVSLFPRIIVTIIDPDWKPVVRNIVLTVFETILKIKLGKMEEKTNQDTKKKKEKYMGSLTKAVWKRKQFARLASLMELDFAEKQAKITEEILKMDQEEYAIQFQVTVTFCQDPRSAVVALRLVAGDVAAFREFGKFFISVMQGWVLSLLRPYTRPPPSPAGRLAPPCPPSDEEAGEPPLPLVVTNSRACASPPPAPDPARRSPPQCY